GKRVVATSRQPVALTTTFGPSIESSTVRTTIGIPQPWQREGPPRSGGVPCSSGTSAFRRDTLASSQADVVARVSGEDPAQVGGGEVAPPEAGDGAGGRPGGGGGPD